MATLLCLVWERKRCLLQLCMTNIMLRFDLIKLNYVISQYFLTLRVCAQCRSVLSIDTDNYWVVPLRYWHVEWNAGKLSWYIDCTTHGIAKCVASFYSPRERMRCAFLVVLHMAWYGGTVVWWYHNSLSPHNSTSLLDRARCCYYKKIHRHRSYSISETETTFSYFVVTAKH